MHTHRLVVSVLLLSFFLTTGYSQHLKVETWYDTEKHILKESYYVLEKNTSVLDSLYTSYYHNGNIKSLGNYSQNKAAGLWEFYYENGNLKMRGELKENSASGKWEYFYESGEINMEGNIEKGSREGEWKFYFENGSVKTSGTYEKNQKEGMWWYFYEDGTYKAQAEFYHDKGHYKETYPSGKIKSEGEIVKGKSSGLWKYYYEDGVVKAEGEEREGLKEGHWKYYYNSGNLASEGNYVKGQEEGDWKYYHENGSLSAQGNIKEGQKDGYWKLYYKDGAFKAEGNFKQGDGSYKEYYESGKLKIEGKVKKGKNDGAWKYYYESGSLEGECVFIEGKGEYTGYYENKKLKMEGMIEDGKKVGIWKLYNEEGELAGYYKTYYENEVPVFIPLPEAVTKDSLKRDSIPPIVKPELKLPKKRLRNYTRKLNEYKDFIVSVHPLGFLRNQAPISVEYYFQERLGYELNYTLLRDPFFSRPSSLKSGYKRGFSTYLRQKLYNKDNDNGMFYWAQEIRFTLLDHYVNDADSTGAQLLQTNEKIYEFSILVGDRILKDSRKKGWTVDIYTGLGIGYRHLSRNYEVDPKRDALFLGLKTKSYTIPFRFGFSIGYLF